MRHALLPSTSLFAFALAACSNSAPPALGSLVSKTRYDFANQCSALQSAATGRFVTVAGSGYAANVESLTDAEPFVLKPSGLGRYLLLDRNSQLLAAGAPATRVDLSAADDSVDWILRGSGDTTVYPPPPAVDVDPDPAVIATYRAFKDPLLRFDTFGLATADGLRLATAGDGTLEAATAESPASGFHLYVLPANRCAEFPEAQDNTIGPAFSGTDRRGRLLGWADSHLHATSTSFLGGAKPGSPFHRFGVGHAVADCSPEHGSDGERDVIGSLFTGDTDGHDTRGWPLFPDWPTRSATTHEATYYKWIERAWKSGLRLIANYAVDNETLCEIQRNASGTPERNCNEMVTAGQQIATAWAMQDYIDAQYGGPGRGWWRIVTTPAAARKVIADGKVAVRLGIEVSNVLGCSVTYNPASTQEAFEETGDPASGGQVYGCAMTETGAPNEILTQLQHLKAIGVTGLFTIHEFDNAFGGNDIFEGLVLNLGNKENSGGISASDQADANAVAAPSQAGAISHYETNGEASGEYWSTYDCPSASDPETGGYLFPVNGAVMTNTGPPPPLCTRSGQGGRPGGPSTCYPTAPQCDARLLTPIGLYAYRKIMEQGFIFEVDHLAYEQRNQVLELGEAQRVPYPTISAHAFSGMSKRQARRIFASGGIVYPTYNDTRDFIALWRAIKPLWQASGTAHAFAFGFGSDTNGLSPQAGPRTNIGPGKAVVYPFNLFSGPPFSTMASFATVEPVRFDQPATRAPDGSGRTWHEDVDGNAHYGMAADSIQELRLEANPELIADLYDSAEVYVQFWERTEAASAAIRRNGLVVPPGLLRPAPVTP